MSGEANTSDNTPSPTKRKRSISHRPIESTPAEAGIKTDSKDEGNDSRAGSLDGKANADILRGAFIPTPAVKDLTSATSAAPLPQPERLESDTPLPSPQPMTLSSPDTQLRQSPSVIPLSEEEEQTSAAVTGVPSLNTPLRSETASAKASSQSRNQSDFTATLINSENVSTQPSLETNGAVQSQDKEMSVSPSRPTQIAPEMTTPSADNQQPLQLADGAESADGSANKRRRTLPAFERIVTRGVSRNYGEGSAASSLSVPKDLATGQRIGDLEMQDGKEMDAQLQEFRKALSHSYAMYTAAEIVNARHEGVDPTMKGYQLYQWQLTVQSQPLGSLLVAANKTVLQKDWQLAREEAKQMKVLNRVEQLKSENKWSFSQIKRHVAPERRKAHWDYLMDEMKWMQEDFIQERKWKKAVAYMLAHAAADQGKAKLKQGTTPPVMKRSSQRRTSLPWESSDMDHSFDANDDQTVPPTAMENGNRDFEGFSSLHSMKRQPSGSSPSAVWSIADELTYCTGHEESGNISTIGMDGTPYHPFMEGSDIYFGESEWDTIVPISRLMTEQNVAAEVSKWDYWGRLKSDIPLGEIYPPSDMDMSIENPFESLPDSSAESESAVDGELPAKAIPEPTHPDPLPEIFASAILDPTAQNSSASEWTSDEDALLLDLCGKFEYNWEFIAEAFQATSVSFLPELPVSMTVKVRTQWDCFRRYKELQEKGVKADSNSNPVPGLNTKVMRRKEREAAMAAAASANAKLEKHLGLFGAIEAAAAKREQQKKPLVRKNVDFNAHETHKMSQERAGVDLNAAPLSAIELSLRKQKRDAEIRQLQEQQRQFLALPRTAMMMGRPQALGPQMFPQATPGLIPFNYRPYRPGMPYPTTAMGAGLPQASVAAAAAAAGLQQNAQLRIPGTFPPGTPQIQAQQAGLQFAQAAALNQLAMQQNAANLAAAGRPAVPGTTAGAAAVPGTPQTLGMTAMPAGTQAASYEQMKMLIERGLVGRLPFAGAIPGQVPLPQQGGGQPSTPGQPVQTPFGAQLHPSMVQRLQLQQQQHQQQQQAKVAQALAQQTAGLQRPSADIQALMQQALARQLMLNGAAGSTGSPQFSSMLLPQHPSTQGQPQPGSTASAASPALSRATASPSLQHQQLTATTGMMSRSPSLQPGSLQNRLNQMGMTGQAGNGGDAVGDQQHHPQTSDSDSGQ
ncbi:hypothetical protein BJ742DRAFT_770897 [Cladochytrium replicatum]|nr:hypothetical protein BJ742DRAFT_770897 [Cladochytrium replicatum]